MKIEEKLYFLQRRIDEFPVSLIMLDEIKRLERLRNLWLKKEEQEWHLKSRTLWLQAGDNNTKIFHHFDNHGRNLNMIWDTKNEDGSLVSSFQEKAEGEARYFERIFTTPIGCPI